MRVKEVSQMRSSEVLPGLCSMVVWEEYNNKYIECN